MPKVTEIIVNGTRRRIDTDEERSLLSILRNDLNLSGTKYGCGEGQCGACTVILDGKSVRSCRTRLASVEDREITTIEGLENSEALHPVQQAFIDAEAMQCAYCTSGMIMSAVALLRKNSKPTDEEIIAAMEGNICRCGTYPRIMNAIRMAVQRIAGGEKA